MIVSLRSDRRQFLSVIVALISFLLISGAWGQESNEISRLAEEARQAFISAEQGSTAKQRASLYQVALARIILIEKFAGMDNSSPSEMREEARSELNRLADDGLNHDMLGAMLLQESLGDLAASSLRVDKTALGVALHQIASEQRSPEYRAAAYIELGYAFSKSGAPDRALRYAALALDSAKSISGAGEQSGAYNSVSRLASSLGSTGMPLAEKAVGLIPIPRYRAYARQYLASVRLKGTPWRKSSEEQLEGEVRKRLMAGDINGSLQLALVLPSSDNQEALLADIVSAAVKSQNYEIAFAAAQGFFSPDNQQKALSRIVDELVAKGVPLQSVNILDGMPDGPAKVSTQLFVASDLWRAGYNNMGEQLFTQALRGIEGLNTAGQPIIWPDVVRALTRADRLDDALGYAKRLDAGPKTSSVLGELSKRLADNGRVVDAQSLLSQIQDRTERSHALSGIGRAKAQTGDIDGALQISGELVDPDDIGRVLSSVVRMYSQSGRFGEATALAERIEDKGYQIDAWVEIGRLASKKKDTKTGEAAFKEAIQVAEGQEQIARDKAYYTIVKSLADLGDRTRALDLKQRIIDDKVRARADEAIAKEDAKQAVERKKQGSLFDNDFKRVLSNMNDEDKQEIALSFLKLPDGIAYASDLVRSIKDDRTRGAAFRHLAEVQMVVLSQVSRHDDRGAIDSVEAVSPGLAEESGSGREIRRRRGLVVTELRDEPPPQAQVPQSFVRAADIRAATPWPSGAAAGVTFANYNLYASKFIDEGPDGRSRLEKAARYQKTPTPRIIVVQSGAATLGMIAHQLEGTQDQGLVVVEDSVLTLRAPVFVAPGARLILSRLDFPSYRFSANAGAFIASAGDLHIVDAEIVGYDEETGRAAWSDESKIHEFRPFLLSWGDGRMNVAASSLTALGYENSKSFGLSYSSGPIRVTEIRDQEHATGSIVDNMFRNLHFGFYSYEAADIQIVGNEYVDSVIYGLDPHDRTRNLTIAVNTTYGTMGKHGILISRDVDESLIVGNQTFDNAGSGIMLDRNSSSNVIFANAVFNNAQDGIALFESSCNLVAKNQIFSNKRDGLKVRNSFEIAAFGNRMESNGGAGVNAYVANLVETKSGEERDFKLDPYDAVTSIALTGNQFSSNSVGINAEGASGLVLLSNKFVKQSRRLLGGDLRGLEGHVLRAPSRTSLLITGSCRPVKPISICSLREEGYFESRGELHVFDPQGPSDCTAIDGTVQQRAFSNTSQGT